MPTLYGANRFDAALAETIFREAPWSDATWSVPRATLFGQVRTLLVPRRELRLIDLTGWAQLALRISGPTLVTCEPRDYPVTALWAQRFHDLAVMPDGIYWRSHRYDDAHVIMIFGDRVPAEDLHVVHAETIALWEGVGLKDLLAVARQARITIIM